jgi:hypothetical protein
MPPDFIPKEKSKEKVLLKEILFFIAGVIVGVLISYSGIFSFGGSDSSSDQVLKSADQKITETDKVLIEKTDLSASAGAVDKLPSGFPADVPSETVGIFESYKAFYKEKDVTQYSVSFYSDSPVDNKYNEYKSFFVNDGYALQDDSLDSTQASLYASRNGRSVSIVISIKDGKTIVQLTVLQK